MKRVQEAQEKRGARKGGGIAMGSRGRGEMRGGEETTGGGGEMMVGRGHLRGRAGIKTGVVDGQVGRGVPAASAEGGKTEGGGYGEERRLPRLLDMGYQLY